LHTTHGRPNPPYLSTPDRLLVGEVRQEECLDLLIALNSGLPIAREVLKQGRKA